MTTYNRICIEDFTLDDEGTAKVERGKEYLTSKEKDGMVTVLSTKWFSCPVNVFAGEKQFT